MHESIGQRIKRLRIARGWKMAELGRRMAKAINRARPFSGEAIRKYESGNMAPHKAARRALAAVFERDEQYIEFGESASGHGGPPQIHDHVARYDARREGGPINDDRTHNPREELVLLYFRALFPEQQLRLVQGLRAAFDSNNITRKYLGQKPLVGVSDEKVRRAFGDAPFHELGKAAAKKKKQGPPPRSGSPLDDFLEE